MKHIKIDIKSTDCDSVYAWATVYDCDKAVQIHKEIDYPIDYSKLQIVEELLEKDSEEKFSFRVDWIGGRPNDRA